MGSFVCLPSTSPKRHPRHTTGGDARANAHPLHQIGDDHPLHWRRPPTMVLDLQQIKKTPTKDFIGCLLLG
jgi:hypothetical protein